MVKWQEINDLAQEVLFFKKRSRSRTIWIRGGLLTSFLSFIGLLSLLTGVTISTSGDIYGCGTECNISINITSTYYRIGVESFPIYFDKEIYYEIYVPTRGKNKWRPFVPGKDFIERKNKYNPLPNRFIVVIHKESWETVKYGVKMIGEHIDPYVYASNIYSIGNNTVEELCNPFYKTWTEEINEQIGCTKTGKVDVSGKIYSGTDSYCKLIGNEVCCAHNKEGGQYAAFWRTDGSVTKYCRDLITNKETFDNSLKVNIKELISVE